MGGFNLPCHEGITPPDRPCAARRHANAKCSDFELLHRRGFAPQNARVVAHRSLLKTLKRAKIIAWPSALPTARLAFQFASRWLQRCVRISRYAGDAKTCGSTSGHLVQGATNEVVAATCITRRALQWSRHGEQLLQVGDVRDTWVQPGARALMSDRIHQLFTGGLRRSLEQTPGGIIPRPEPPSDATPAAPVRIGYRSAADRRPNRSRVRAGCGPR